MEKREYIIQKIFNLQNENGCWKTLNKSDKHYPQYEYYYPKYNSTLWTLIFLADINHNKKDFRVQKPLNIIKEHFYDSENNIYTLQNDHFPIPCLNGNIIYIDCYFNKKLSKKSANAIDFFHRYQRFDDGEYIKERNKYCKNKSCYGKHTCYWGVTKLLKGLSFIPLEERNVSANELILKCINFILLHHVCYSSHNNCKIIAKNIDKLTFPNMYSSDILEILWLLKREKVHSENINKALNLLSSKRLFNGHWNLERKMNNLITSIGEIDKPNYFITERAKEISEFYSKI